MHNVMGLCRSQEEENKRSTQTITSLRQQRTRHKRNRTPQKVVIIIFLFSRNTAIRHWRWRQRPLVRIHRNINHLLGIHAFQRPIIILISITHIFHNLGVRNEQCISLVRIQASGASSAPHPRAHRPLNRVKIFRRRDCKLSIGVGREGDGETVLLR